MKAQDPREFARGAVEPGDALGGAWFLSRLVAFVAGLAGLAVVWRGGGHRLAAVALGVCLMAGAAGLVLRIDAARVFLLGLTGLISLAAAGFWVVHLLGADSGGSGGSSLAAALVFGALAVALASPASRRLCSRWGLLRRRT